MSVQLSVRLLLCMVLTGCNVQPRVQPLPEQPPPVAAATKLASPDWRDQVIYFLMIDRFDDGDPGNNDQGSGEFDPSRGAYFSGGDLKGVQRRIDYIQELGAGTVWITPPVANQWWDPSGGHTGYHGYWASDFMAVDRHFGSLTDYQQLAQALHGAGMYLVQDIVVNHTGNFFGYDGPWDARDPTRNFQRYPDHAGHSAPTQSPFDLNDVRDPQQRAAAIYHYTPNIIDFADPEQEANWQMSGLDDLNTENPQVRSALRQSYGYWIREVGVDGYRVDTAFYVPPAYFEDFLYADDPRFPGILKVAAATGRKQFHVFGEGFGIDAPGTDTSMHKIDRYMRGSNGQPRLPGMLNFPLYGSLVDVYARGQPTAELANRIEAMMRIHAQPHLLPSFIDNHDVDRFLAGGSEAALRQALLAILTLPGIPTIYYGTEQGFREPRAAMFAAGYGSEGRDHFDTQAPLFRFLKEAIALRRTHPLLSRGTPEMLFSTSAGPGAIAWRMRQRKEQVIVVFNTSEQRILLDHLATGLPGGSTLQPLFGIDRLPPAQDVDANGQVNLMLPPRSGYVWEARSDPTEAPPQAPQQLTLDPIASAPYRDDFSISGHAERAFHLVIDGQIDQAAWITPDANGRWHSLVDTGAMLDPAVEHRLVGWDPASAAASANARFRVQRDWTLLADIADPDGDDHGPRGHYRYPTDPGWSEQRPADIEHIRVFGAGGSLKVELRMHQLLTPWNPPNGFDHVVFTLFVEVPDHCPGEPPDSTLTGCAEGQTVMPGQDGSLPQGMRWHYRLRSHGWSNALFNQGGSSAKLDGSAVVPSASISTDKAARTVSFVLPRAALGNRKSLSGVRLYVNTWDYDGGYRELAAEPGPHSFGGAGPGAPKVMDDSVVIELP
jgi:glycosidase